MSEGTGSEGRPLGRGGLLARAGVGKGNWKPGGIIKEIKAERQGTRAEQQQQSGASSQTSSQTDDVATGAVDAGGVSSSTIVEEGEKVTRRSPVPSGWYPGKYLSVGVRKAINKKLKHSNLEATQRRQDGAKVVGKLHWKLKSVRGIHVFNPYFEVVFEGTKRVIKARTFQEEYIQQAGEEKPTSNNQWTETDLVFDITDITASCYVMLLDKRLRTFTVGALILPLANFLDWDKPKPCRTYVCDLVPPTFLDLDKKLIGQKYTPQLPGGTDSPLPPLPTPLQQQLQPPESGAYVTVGQVVIEVEVTVNQPHLLQTYLASRPLMEDSFIKRKKKKGGDDGGSEEQQLEALEMEKLIVNVYRINVALKPAPLLTKLVELPYLSLPLWAYMCFSFTLWKVPIWALAFWSLNGYLNSYHESLPHPVESWPPALVEKFTGMKQTNPLEKIKRIRGLFKMLQDKLGLLASTLERSTNISNWSDPRVSITLYLLLIPLAAVTSFVLYLVPPSAIFFTLGLAVYARASAIKGGGPPPPTTSAPARPRPAGEGEGVDEEGEEDGDDDGDEVESDLQLLDVPQQWSEFANPRLLLPRIVSNVVARTPDFLEKVHRAIAANRVKTAPTLTSGN